MKRKIALAMTLAMTASMAQPVLAFDATPISLDVIISQYGTQTQDWWSQFETDFEAENPDIDLNIEIVSWNDLYTKVNTLVANNNAPDILNIDVLADYVADDLLMPATEYAIGLVNDGYTNSDPANETRYDLQDMFGAGKVAMMIGPNNIPTYLSDGRYDINYDVTTIPANEGFLPTTQIVAGGSTLIAIVCGIPAAYALARMKFKEKKIFLGIVIISQMFAPVVLLVGIYKIMALFNMTDSLIGLVFINAWNEYTVALTLISTDVFIPLTVGITIFNVYNMIEWQYLFASSLFTTIPVIILFVLIEKHLFGGLTSGGVKG